MGGAPRPTQERHTACKLATWGDVRLLILIGERVGRGWVTFQGVSVVSDEKPSLDVATEREQTDESLRVERDKVDQALMSEPISVDETADAVIARARERADAVLAATRARMDRQSMTGLGPEAVRARRAHADAVLRDERSAVDEATREARAEHVVLLAAERSETDKDLLIERARADAAVATRDDFLGIVSHDLRDILNIMIGSATLITTDVSRPDHVDLVLSHAKRIRRSASRMNRMIGDLVDVASIHAGALTVMCEVGDPAHVVAEAVDTFDTDAKAAGLQLESQVPPGLPPASFDPARVLQVLTNLISNAIKFTPKGGQIVVRVAADAGNLRFSVQDTGVGIPADKLELVFARFLQVFEDRRGVGLGLYISKCIVHGHGGRIWADSTPGKGSTFSFTLPLNAGSSAPVAPLGRVGSPQHQRAHPRDHVKPPADAPVALLLELRRLSLHRDRDSTAVGPDETVCPPTLGEDGPAQDHLGPAEDHLVRTGRRVLRARLAAVDDVAADWHRWRHGCGRRRRCGRHGGWRIGRGGRRR